jgi:hypothetical protein
VSTTGAAPAATRSRRVLLIRSICTAIAAVVAAVGSWLLLQNGIRTDAYPAFLPGTENTEITRYSGPWLTAAAGVALVGALLLLSSGIDLVRWYRSGGTA